MRRLMSRRRPAPACIQLRAMTGELSENVVDRDGRVPEALDFLAELVQVRISPIIEVETNGPYSDRQLAKPTDLLGNPNDSLPIFVGEKRIAVVNDAHVERQ